MDNLRPTPPEAVNFKRPDAPVEAPKSLAPLPLRRLAGRPAGR